MLNDWQKKFLKNLQDKKLLREGQIAEVEAMLSSGQKTLFEILAKGGFVDGEKLAKAVADFFNLPYVNLLEKEIPNELLLILPRKLAEENNALCFAKEKNILSVALIDPNDYVTREAVDFFVASNGLNAQYFVCSTFSFAEVAKRLGTFSAEVQSAVSAASKARAVNVKQEENENFSEVVKRAPVAEIVSMVIKNAINNHSSDIHIEPFESYSRVRFRVDGILSTVLNLPIYLHDSIISRIKVLSGLKIDETRVPQDGRFKFKGEQTEYDLRVSVMPLFGKEKVTMRILDISGTALTLDQLGFSENTRQIIGQAIKQTYGMVLVSGPTGSGKSTTLFSILSLLNKEGINITTLEDPIEYNIPGINQAQIRPEVKFTFASGLRSLMRQDPDIIMVGEIRDSETAEMAVHAALTGHLLFSTLHTNDSIGSIPRLIDMKVEPFLLASTLNLVIAQRLTRRICPKCKESYELGEEASQKIKNQLKSLSKELLPAGINLNLQKLIVYKGKGCTSCKNTGYTGRLVISEVLPINNRLRELIVNDFPQEKVRAEIASLGLINLLQDGIIKALLGMTTVEEVFRVSKEIEDQD
ncbi:MAG: GspE/PulE family protein [Patescibacteria group bacterium]